MKLLTLFVGALALAACGPVLDENLKNKTPKRVTVSGQTFDVYHDDEMAELRCVAGCQYVVAGVQNNIDFYRTLNEAVETATGCDAVRNTTVGYSLSC